jgi:hypothetical protein
MIGWLAIFAAQAAVPTAAPAPVPAPAEATSTLSPHCAPGIYIETGTGESPQLVPIAAVAIESRKVSNLGGFMLTGGISGLKVKSVLPEPHAANQLATRRPVFRFCFAVAAVGSADAVGSAYVGSSTAASNPADFRLVQFESKKQQRELSLAKSTMFRGIKTTLSDATYRFDSVEIAPGQFRVTLDYDLPPGEYGFVRGTGGAQLKAPKKGQPPGVGEPGQPVYAFGLTKS